MCESCQQQDAHREHWDCQCCLLTYHYRARSENDVQVVAVCTANTHQGIRDDFKKTLLVIEFVKPWTHGLRLKWPSLIYPSRKTKVQHSDRFSSTKSVIPIPSVTTTSNDFTVSFICTENWNEITKWLRNEVVVQFLFSWTIAST